MRRAAQTLTSGAALFAGSLAVWGAVVGFALWGALYIWDCVALVLAPGVPVQVEYEGQAGRYRLEAESYSVDPVLRRASLHRLSLSRPDGTRAARARQVDLSLRGPAVVAVARGVEASVVRGRGGRLDLEGALPKPVPGQVGPPLDVLVTDATVAYRDATQSPNLDSRLQLSGVRFAQADQDLWARAVVRLPGGQPQRVEIQASSEERLWVSWESRSTRLDPLVAHALRWIDAKALEPLGAVGVGSLVGGGQLEASRIAGEWAIDGRVGLEFRGLSVGRDLAGADGRLDWEGSPEQGRLSVSVRELGREARFAGQVAFAPSLWAEGDLEAAVADRRRVWSSLGRALPRELAWRGARFRGGVAFAEGRPGVSGRLDADRVIWGEESLAKVRTDFDLAGELLAVRVREADWRGQRGRGAFRLDLGLQSLRAVAVVPNVQLGRLPLGGAEKRIKGTAELRAVFQGPMKRLETSLWAEGKGVVDVPERGPLAVDRFEARVEGQGDRFEIQRFAAFTPTGVLLADGPVAGAGGRLDLRFEAGSVNLGRWVEGLEGVAAAKGRIGGTLESPTVEAQIVAAEITVGATRIPQVVADVSFDRGAVDVTRVRAWAGGGRVEGAGRLVIADGTLSFNASGGGLALAALFGPDFAGQVSIESAEVSGTLDAPVARARLRSEAVRAYGVELDAMTAEVSLEGQTVRVTGGRASVFEGVLVATGSYALDEGAGRFQVDFSRVPASGLGLSELGLETDGTLSGGVEGTVDREGRIEGDATLRLASISVNEAAIGSGEVKAQVREGRVTASGVIGTTDRYIELASFGADLEARSWAAKVNAFEIPLPELFRAARLDSRTVEPRLRELARESDGVLTGTVDLESDGLVASAPLIDLEATQLKLAGRDAGTLKLVGSQSGPEWDLRELTWVAGPSRIAARGALRKDEAIELDLNVSNFDLTWASTLLPQAPVVAGQLSGTGVLGGTIADPKGRASLFVRTETFLTEDDGNVAVPIVLNVDDLVVADRQVVATGQAYYEGFTGGLRATVPFSALDESLRFNQRSPLRIEAEFERRPLSAFAEYLPALDHEMSEGDVAGTVTVEGLLEALDVRGRASLNAPALRFKSAQATLTDASLDASFDGNRLRIVGAAKGGQGGSARLDAGAGPIPLGKGRVEGDALLAGASLSGTLQLEDINITETLPGSQAASSGTVGGSILFGGTLLAPRIGGDVTVARGVLFLPNEPMTAAEARYEIDPAFDRLRLNVQDVRIEAGIGSLDLYGSGELAGSLSAPEVAMPLKLAGGEFRLPNARISLAPEGDILVTLSSLGVTAGALRIDVDLEGETRIVARRSTGEFESYNVALNVTGNLLDSQNLRLTASSDPPDLRSEEILAVIGQRDLISGLAQFALGDRSDSAFLRASFYQAALPALSQGVTRGFAQGLGLDYLTLDYDPFAQFVVSAGKRLGRGLLLQGRRQVQQEGEGPLRFEIKVTYRPPSRAGVLNRVRFGVGLTEAVPWRFSIDWARRF